VWCEGLRKHVRDILTTESDFEVSDLEKEELLKSPGLHLEKELQLLTMPTPYEKVRTSTTQQWENAEKTRGLGYNGLSARTRRRQDQKARSKEKHDELPATCVSSFRSFTVS
jgi:hypothetical protein